MHSECKPLESRLQAAGKNPRKRAGLEARSSIVLIGTREMGRDPRHGRGDLHASCLPDTRRS